MCVLPFQWILACNGNDDTCVTNKGAIITLLGKVLDILSKPQQVIKLQNIRFHSTEMLQDAWCFSVVDPARPGD